MFCKNGKHFIFNNKPSEMLTVKNTYNINRNLQNKGSKNGNE